MPLNCKQFSPDFCPQCYAIRALSGRGLDTKKVTWIWMNIMRYCASEMHYIKFKKYIYARDSKFMVYKCSQV